MSRHQFLLVETSTATFDQIEILIHLVRPIEGKVNQRVLGQRVKPSVFQLSVHNQLPGLTARGDVEDLRDALVFQGPNRFDDIDDCAARADADVFGRGVEVVGDGLVGGVSLGAFEVGHFYGRGR